MAKTKISEFSATPANNTDIDSINISEGCAPSGINDAIRELMAQLKDFQTGAQGDSFNGPIGTSTAAAGAFTTLSATGAITSTLATGTAPLVIASTTKVANLNVDLLDGADWAAPAALGSTTPAAGSFTTLGASSTATLNTLVSSGATLTGGTINGMTIGATTASTGAFTTLSASSTVNLSGGTANGVPYLNGSKVLTSGSALTFDGTNLGVPRILQSGSGTYGVFNSSGAGNAWASYQYASSEIGEIGQGSGIISGGSNTDFGIRATNNLVFGISYNEQMRLTSTGLGIGTSSPLSGAKLTVASGSIAVTGQNTAHSANSLRLGEEGSGVAQIRAYGPDASTKGALQFRNSTSDGSSYVDMLLDSSGNLGLGVTPSAWGSNFRAMDVGSYTSVAQSSSGFSRIANNCYNNNTNWIYRNTAAATLYETGGGSHAWNIAASGTAGNAITFTQAMSLTAGGNLVLGATDSDFRLSSIVQSGADRDVFQAAILGASNGFRIKWNHATSTIRINISNLPTSATGLTSGDLWNDGGTLKIA